MQSDSAVCTVVRLRGMYCSQTPQYVLQSDSAVCTVVRLRGMYCSQTPRYVLQSAQIRVQTLAKTNCYKDQTIVKTYRYRIQTNAKTVHSSLRLTMQSSDTVQRSESCRDSTEYRHLLRLYRVQKLAKTVQKLDNC